MIDRQGLEYIPICDNCGEPTESGADSFQGAIDLKKEAGWTTKNHSVKGCQDICPTCQE